MGDIFDTIELPKSNFDIFDTVQLPAPVPESPAFTPDEPGLADEFNAVGRGLNRGVRRFIQQGSVTGLRRPAQLEDDLKKAEADLSAFDAQWQGKPDVTGRLKQLRDNQLGKIAELRGEMQRYAAMAPDLAQGLSEQQAAINKLPPSQAQDEFDKAEGFLGKLKVVARNPIEMAAITTAESLPSMIGPTIGSALGPIGTAVGASASSFTAESSANVISGMQQAGVDVTKPAEVLGFFKDRARLDPVAAKADLKALGPATFDGLTAGFAGKILKPFLGKGAGKVAAGRWPVVRLAPLHPVSWVVKTLTGVMSFWKCWVSWGRPRPSPMCAVSWSRMPRRRLRLPCPQLK
jgi:hypothetical protein